MEWTKEVPTVDGWYWVRVFGKFSDPCPWLLDDGKWDDCGDKVEWPVSDADFTLFYGPIEPPPLPKGVE